MDEVKESLEKFSEWLNFDDWFLESKKIKEKFYSTSSGNFLKCVYRIRAWSSKRTSYSNGSLTPKPQFKRIRFEMSVLIKLNEKGLPSFQVYLPKEGRRFKGEIIERIVSQIDKMGLEVRIEDEPFLTTPSGEYFLVGGEKKSITPPPKILMRFYK